MDIATLTLTELRDALRRGDTTSVAATHWRKVIETAWPTNFTGPATQDEREISPGESQTVTMVNATVAESFVLEKASNNPAYVTDLSGASFDFFYDANADGSYETGPIATRTTDVAGNTSPVTGIAPGAWQGVETSPLPGHQPMTFTFTVTSGGTNVVQVVRVTNIETPKVLRIRKVDAADPSVTLPGATYEVRGDMDNDVTTGPNGFEGAPVTAVTSGTGEIDVEPIPGARYEIFETVAPDGYLLGEEAERRQIVTVPTTAIEPVIVTFANRKPTITTQVKAATVPVGGLAVDTSVRVGMSSTSTGTITNELYGPFPPGVPITANACVASKLVGSTTTDVVGAGTSESEGIPMTVPGNYTFVETWSSTGPGENASATHPCGEATETFNVPVPTITTQVSNDRPALGATVTDTAVLTGVADGVEGVITVELYRSGDALPTDGTCVEANLVERKTFEVVGSGTFTSPEFPTSEPDTVFTFVETWRAVDSDITVTATHKCGDLTETFRVVTPPVPVTPRGPLPFTGASSLSLMLAGFGALIIGVLIRRGSKRPPVVAE